MKSNIVFGTDGWRGIIDKDVNETSVAEAAQAFAVYLKLKSGAENITTAVGYDGRKNSKLYADIFAEVLSGNNINVILSDKIIPTPVLSYYTKLNKLDSGVMVTASHNPPEYNGIKFKASYGGPYFTEETLQVEKLLFSSPVKRSSDNIVTKDLLIPYINQICNIINFDIINKSGIKILIDSMSGAGQKLLENIFADNNISAETIFSSATEDFSGRQAEPIEKNLFPLSKRLKSGNYSLGIATDGDADRLGVMLDNGEWLSAQDTILLLADYICNKKNIPGDIVKTSSVTDKIRILENNSRKVKDVQVGFKYICEEMINSDVAFGCEESGGFGYGFHMPERDGILSGLLFCEMLASSGFDKLSIITELMRRKYGEIFYKRQDLVYIKDDRISLLPRLFKYPPSIIDKYKITGIKEFFSSREIINGLKFYLEGDSRWLLIRASETEPLIRVYAEAENMQEVENILNSGINIINNKKVYE